MKPQDLGKYFDSLRLSQPLIAPYSANKIGLVVISGKSLPTWTTPYGEKVVDWAEVINPELTDPTYTGAYTYIVGWDPVKEEWT